MGSRLEGLQRLLVIINKLEGKKRYVPQRFCHGASFPKPFVGSDKSFASQGAGTEYLRRSVEAE